MRRPAVRARGHSLTELLIVMGMVGFVMTTATQLVHQVMRYSTQSRRDVDLQRVCRPAAICLREDARAATSVEWLTSGVEPGEVLRCWRRDAEYVDYRVASSELQRSVVRDGRRVHFEEFSFGPEAAVELVFRPKDRPPDGGDPRDAPPPGSLRLRVNRKASHGYADREAGQGGQVAEGPCVLDVWLTTGRYHRPIRFAPAGEASP